MSDLLHDLRLAARTLGRTPAFTAAALLILAIGIGANAAIFSIVHRVLVRPVPFDAPERIVRVWETYSNGKGRGSVSAPNFRDWRREATDFDAMAAYWPASRNLQDASEPERVEVLESTASLFGLLGARPVAGRLFEEREEAPGAERVALISEGLWKRRFAADPAAVGRAIRLDGTPHAIVGVLPASFRFPVYGERTEIYLPHVVSDAAQRGNHYLSVLARLRPGVDLASGRQQLEQIAARLAQAWPENQTGRGVELRTLDEAIRGPARPLLTLLFGAVALVLLIACANLAGLALARATARQRDVSIRAALGASRGRLSRELLLESLVVAAGGALLGAAVAAALLEALAPRAAEVLPDLGALRLDGATFGFLFLAAAGTGLACGLLPALAVSRLELARGLVEAGARSTAGRGRQRLRRLLVAGQVGLSLTLLVAAGLLLRTFFRLESTSPGFDRVGVLTLHLSPAAAPKGDGSLAGKLLTPVLDRVRALPGVELAGVFTILPVQNWGTNSSYSIEGMEPPKPGEDWWVETRAASPGAFKALGVPLRAGRWLLESDALAPGGALDTPYPALVNEAFVRRHFPAGDALGRQIRFGETDLATIVGVYGDTRQGGLDQEPLPEVSVAYNDFRNEGMFGARDAVLVVRSSLPAAALAGAVRAAVRAVDPGQPVHTIRTVEQVIDDSLAGRRFMLVLVGCFAATAALLAGTGLYALVSYLVAQRRREIGVRLALGATARQIARWVLGEGILLALSGIAVGALGGWAATRLVASQLHGVRPGDPLTWIGVVLFVLAVAVVATLAPSLRAARTEPSQVLRQE